jgi:hypothetical protein
METRRVYTLVLDSLLPLMIDFNILIVYYHLGTSSRRVVDAVYPNGVKEVWTSRASVEGLPELDFDVSNSERLENAQAAEFRVVSVLAEESLGKDTNPKYNGTEGLCFSDLDKVNDVYGREPDLY